MARIRIEMSEEQLEEALKHGVAFDVLKTIKQYFISENRFQVNCVHDTKTGITIERIEE